MTIETESLGILQQSVERLAQGFEQLPAYRPEYDRERAESVLLQVAEKMWDNYPYPHPQYAGQMLKPPHPVARMAYMLAMWINPNNHALDGGKASSAMEKEVVAEIARMFGWDNCLGHLTGGGTLANLEALWIANQQHPGKTIVASAQAHYTHNRICGVLQIPFRSVPVDDRARMDVGALARILEQEEVGTVVVTLGTTGVGSVDPLPEILELQRRYGFRIHVDSAYGGYYRLVDTLPPDAVAAYTQISQVDSIVVDPHKHGLQPYGCGCVLFRDPEVGRFYKHDSPYTYFSSDELHLGEISLECSRAGASAVALWATMQMYPLTTDGEFADGLRACRQAAVMLHRRLKEDPRFITPLEPDLDIVIWAPKAESTGAISKLSQQVFEQAEARDLYLATFSFPSELVKKACPEIEIDTPYTTCLRSSLMKPEHLGWIEEIWRILDEAQENLA
ncbi:aspartate aminotransferase family protein [Marinobacter halodurans]|uniref:Aspartate aminotransferase family protein n=1 Tax=Marinobacter halodurans TaxID=2528979 RepID=A0ABY1ZDI5_9GAMM|nr:aminotransferase class I/II-fold pyridoxal phosphate-dependent enzyme [Marinobacter halodurans]TBW46893.1 aspartate aminotransferase family protein [Marinobacter halodurans]